MLTLETLSAGYDGVPVVRDLSLHVAAGLVVAQLAPRALEVADRASVHSHGRLVLEGPAAELRGRPDLLRSSYLGDAAVA